METYTPEFPTPYPDRADPEITDFEYVSPLVLYRGATALKTRGGKGDADYVVGAPYEVRFKVDGNERRITVPRGMLTDLASVPAAARSVVGRVGPHLEASIVHDFLYIAWQDLPNGEARKSDRDFADELMRVAMIKADVGWITRTLINGAVRLAGWFVYRGQNPPPRYVVLPADATATPEGEPDLSVPRSPPPPTAPSGGRRSGSG